MPSSLFKISGGTVYDPRHGLDGVVRDLWICDGKIVNAPADPQVRPDRTLDARGLVVMPGGIDMHCHIAGPKVNVARKMRPEEKRLATPVMRTANTHSGTMGSVPSTFATGYKYAGMGYTTAFDAAIPPRPRATCTKSSTTRPASIKAFMSWLETTITSCARSRKTSPSGCGPFWAGYCRRPRGTPPRWSILAASKSGNSSRAATSADWIRWSNISTSRHGRSFTASPARPTS